MDGFACDGKQFFMRMCSGSVLEHFIVHELERSVCTTHAFAKRRTTTALISTGGKADRLLSECPFHALAVSQIECVSLSWTARSAMGKGSQVESGAFAKTSAHGTHRFSAK